MIIKESIIVEGRDDAAALGSCVEANIIITHGFGIRKSVWDEIKMAYENTGIIIFTDPDFAGKNIRRQISEKFPNAKHAYISRESANLNGNIGVENASCADIKKALSEVITEKEGALEKLYTYEDMLRFGLTGKNSRKLRELVGMRLSIGHNNTKIFIKKLNKYSISEEKLINAIKDVKEEL